MQIAFGMKRLIALPLLALLSACGGANTVERLEHTKWSDNISPCSVNYMNFDNGIIAAHPHGKLLPLWEIKSSKWFWTNPNRVDLQVEPIGGTLIGARLSGHYRPGLVMHFELIGNKLRFLSTSLGNKTIPVVPGDPNYYLNLVACPQDKQ